MRRRFTVGFALVLFAAIAICPDGAAASPVVSAAKQKSDILQFTSGGHVLGFTSKDVYVATGSHALRVELIGPSGTMPVAEGAAATVDGKAAPLGRVSYPNAWEGITLTYEAGHGGIFRSTYTLAAGADPEQIRLRYNTPVTVEPDGSLRVASASGWMSESAPVAWQEVQGCRVPVSVSFRKESNMEVGFALGSYDKTRALIIDPTLTWNTFLGGTDYDYGAGIAIDASGNVYVTGQSNGTWGVPIRAWTGSAGYGDAFVAKLGTNGALIWNTFLGGVNYECGYGIAVDASGNVYVTGQSNGTWGAPIRAYSEPLGSSDAFVAKLGINGTLLWSTFLGGTDYDGGYGIAVDASGNVYVTGYSGTWGAPIRAWTGSAGYNDAFVAKLGINGTLLWNTFLGGTGYDNGSGIAVDASGNVYVSGMTQSTWGAPIRTWTESAGSSDDAFVAKLSTNGTLLWNTFLGGTGSDNGSRIAIDANGNIYVTGTSYVTWGDPIQTFAGGGTNDTFVAKLDTNGALMWNTFLGGAESDGGSGIAVNASGNVYVSGSSRGTWGAPIRAWTGSAGSSDAFVAKLGTNGALLWNTFLGGTNGDYGYGIAVDARGNVYVSGPSYGTWGAPILPFAGSWGNGNAFVAMIGNIAVHHVKNDFDGDGRSDIGCYYPTGGNWYGFNSTTEFWQTQFGYEGTIPITGDFDGDRKADIGCYYAKGGNWYLYMSSEGFRPTQFGYEGTIPIVGDFDGDGRSDFGCYHAQSGNWYVYMSSDGFWWTQFGYAGTIPIVGDFDGDGKDDIGCYYAKGGNWYVYKSTEGFWQTTFGYDGTIPVVGDFDGDGKDDIGCYYPAGGNWYLFKSKEGFWQTTFGYSGTEPVVGDFDGDGKDDIGCYYPTGGNWYLYKSTEGFWQTQFGYSGTIPLGGTLR